MLSHTLLSVLVLYAASPPLPATHPQPEAAPPSAVQGPDHAPGWSSIDRADLQAVAAAWRSPAPLWRSWPDPASGDLALYHARTRPGAEGLAWALYALDSWLALALPGKGLPRSPAIDTRVLSTVPVPGETSSKFGYRFHPIRKRRMLHKGLDFKASRGKPVVVAGPGRVTFAGRKHGYGNVVMVAHGLGLETRYAHLQRLRTKTGALVAAGQLIGTVGTTGLSTGPHLHFEVRQFGEPIDPAWPLGMREPSMGEHFDALWRWIAP